MNYGASLKRQLCMTRLDNRHRGSTAQGQSHGEILSQHINIRGRTNEGPSRLLSGDTIVK